MSNGPKDRKGRRLLNKRVKKAKGSLAPSIERRPPLGGFSEPKPEMYEELPTYEYPYRLLHDQSPPEDMQTEPKQKKKGNTIRKIIYSKWDKPIV